MIFQNQKLLLILAKIEGQKNEVIDLSKLNIMVNTFRCLSFLYFMSIHAEQIPQNLLVTNAQAFHQYFSQNQTLQLVLSIIVLILHLLFFGSLIFLIFQSQKLLLQREMRRKQQIIKISALIDTIISTIGITIAALLISVLSLKTLQQDHSQIFNLVAVILSVVNSYVMPSISFSSHFFFILAFYDVSSLFGNIVLLISSFYIFSRQKKLTLALKITDMMALQFIAVQLLKCNITTYQITSTFSILIFIELITPQQSIFRLREHQNDFLINIAEKLRNETSLSMMQKIKISLIFQKNQSSSTEHRQNKVRLNISQQQLNQFDPFFQILLQKIKKDVTLQSSNNHYKLQQIRCYLISNKISIKILKSFHEIRGNIINKSDSSEIKRLQLIINKIEEVFFKNSKEINYLIIMAVEREVQRFYRCLGYSVEELLIFWRMVAKNEGDQFKLEYALQKVVQSQKQSLQVIENLKQQKNLSAEVRTMNYFHKIISANPDPFISDYTPKKQIKITNTTFLLISNNIIQQISVKLSKQLSSQKKKMIGNEMNLIFQNPISSFLLQQMDKLALHFSQDNNIYIPFNFYHSHFKFHVYRCSFQFIPDLSKGIKYLINVVDQQQSYYSYILYNSQNDMIIGASDSMFSNHKIQQNVDLSKMYGQELFNIDIANHLLKNKDGEYNQINCHLMTINLLKKSNYRHLRKNYQPQITIKVKQQYQLKNSKYLLLQISDQNHKTRSSEGEITYIRFMDQQFDKTLNMKENNSRQQNDYFCKINNPLKSLVDQKLSKINSSFRISYYQIVVWLINFGMLLFISFLIFIILTTKSTTQILSQQFDQINKANDLRFNLYDIFQQLYQLYQIKKDPQFFINNLNIKDVNIQTQLLKQKINLLIQGCLSSIYANNIQIQQKNVEIIFENYVNRNKINPITLINFLSEIKKSLVQQDIELFIRNSNQIYSIINLYIIPTAESFTKFFSMIQYFMVLFLVIWGLIIGGCQFIFIKIQIFKRKIFQIYGLVTLQERNQYIQNLQQLLQCLLKTSYSLKSRTEKSITSNISEQEAKSLKREPVRQAIKQNKMVYSLIKTSVICLIPLILSLFQVFFYLYVDEYCDSINSALQHNQRINNLLSMIKQEQMLYFQSQIKTQMTSNHSDHSSVSNIQRLISINNQLPNYFDEYLKIQKRIYYGEICSTIKYNQMDFFKEVNCSRILEGTLNDSLSSAYSLLIHKLFRNKFNFQTDNSLKHYPFVIEVFYSGYYIEKTIKSFQIRFRQNSQSFFTYIENSIQSVMIVGFMIIFIGFFILVIVFRRISSVCTLAFRTFSVLPRRSITKLSTSKQLRNMGILDEIGLIAI